MEFLRNTDKKKLALDSYSSSYSSSWTTTSLFCCWLLILLLWQTGQQQVFYGEVVKHVRCT